MTNVHPESVVAIARKDFQDSVRSWVFWGLSTFFFALLVTTTASIWYFADDPIFGAELTTGVLVGVTSSITRVIIPVIALILGWKAIAGEWESGSMKVLLSLPHSRKDVVLGKLLGRAVVLALSLVIGFALAAVVVAALMGGFDVVDYVGLLVMSIIYGVAYVSLAVAVSAMTKSTTIAGAGVFGIFLLFYVVWNAAFNAIQLLVQFEYIDGVEYTTEFQGEEIELLRLPDWAYLFDMFDPGTAYSNVLTLATDAAEIEGAAQIEADMFHGSIPFFLQDWFSFVVLLFWILAPLAVAVYHFERVDL